MPVHDGHPVRNSTETESRETDPIYLRIRRIPERILSPPPVSGFGAAFVRHSREVAQTHDAVGEVRDVRRLAKTP